MKTPNEAQKPKKWGYSNQTFLCLRSSPVGDPTRSIFLREKFSCVFTQLGPKAVGEIFLRKNQVLLDALADAVFLRRRLFAH